MNPTTTRGVPVNIRFDILRQIDGIAEQQQIQPELLINTILEQYVSAQSVPQPSRSGAFLLSIAGMFDSGANTASEHVSDTLKESILQKYAKEGSA